MDMSDESTESLILSEDLRQSSSRISLSIDGVPLLASGLLASMASGRT